jgi:predicted Zn-ribbon and HTH transcriptional regulator
MSTRREEITKQLEEAEYPLTAQDLCEILGLKKRSIIYEDIDHIARSVKNRGKQVIVSPARCGKCQFIFKKMKSSKAPTKCPKCRSEWIIAPGYLIRDKKSK